MIFSLGQSNKTQYFLWKMMLKKKISKDVDFIDMNCSNLLRSVQEKISPYGMSIPDRLTVISWYDWNLAQNPNIACEETINLYEENKINNPKIQNVDRWSTEHAIDSIK